MGFYCNPVSYTHLDVYKRQLLVELDKNTYKSLKDTTSIKTKIDKDNETLWADLSLLTKDGKYFACLTYNTSMIRYVDDRYLDVELITEDKSGLKIPKTSVVEKEYYEVPSEDVYKRQL